MNTMIKLFLTSLLLASVLSDNDNRLPKDTLPVHLDLEKIPLGLDQERPIPSENPLTKQKVELGRKLFFDPILSRDRTISCASCHDPEHGFATADPLAKGVDDRLGRRNSPSLLNISFGKRFFWDGRAASLEDQALKPIENKVEFDNRIEVVIERLKADDQYVALFREAFGEAPNPQSLAKAIASFERTLFLADTVIDRFQAAQDTSLTKAQRQGLWIFESKGMCWKCHSGNNLTDERFHNTGVSWGKQPLDLGRFEITSDEKDRGKFKTPSLRGVGLTAPYMHNGSIKSLREVVKFYNQGGGKNPLVDRILKPLNLTEEDENHLVEFLKALSKPADQP